MNNLLLLSKRSLNYLGTVIVGLLLLLDLRVVVVWRLWQIFFNVVIRILEVTGDNIVDVIFFEFSQANKILVEV